MLSITCYAVTTVYLHNKQSAYKKYRVIRSCFQWIFDFWCRQTPVVKSFSIEEVVCSDFLTPYNKCPLYFIESSGGKLVWSRSAGTLVRVSVFLAVALSMQRHGVFLAILPCDIYGSEGIRASAQTPSSREQSSPEVFGGECCREGYIRAGKSRAWLWWGYIKRILE